MYRVKIQKLMWIVYLMLAVFLSVVIGSGLIRPDSFGTLRGVWSPAVTICMLGGGVLLFLLLLSAVFAGVFSLQEKTRFRLLLILTLAGVTVQIFLTVRYPLQIWWDNTSVLSSAISIVTGQKEYFDKIYFNQLGHQNCFLLLTVLLYKLARLLHVSKDALCLYFSLVDLLAMDGAAALMLLLLKKVKGTGAAQRALLFLILCPGMYLWCGYYYTTNMSLLFLSLYFYLAYLIWEKKRNPMVYFAFGLLAVFGCRFRMTMLLAVLATACYFVLKRPKAVLRMMVLTLLGACVMTALLRFADRKMVPDYDENERFPLTHWLMMAAQGSGEYNDADLAYTSSFETKEEKAQATRDEYFRRLSELGAAGVVKLCVKKTINNWSYGNHAYYPLFHRYDRLSDILWTPDQQCMLWLEQIWHLTSLLLTLAGVLFSARRLLKKAKEEGYETGFEGLLQIFLLGGFFFYLLWETYPYYSVGFLFVFVFLSADGLGALQGVKRIRKPAALGAIPVLLLVGFLYFRTPWPESVSPVVTQKKYNGMYYLENGSSLSQTFKTSRRFDTITFWVTKKDLTSEAGGSYEISLSGEKSGEIFKESYDTAALTRVDEVTKTFPQVTPAGNECFTLSVKKISDTSDDPIGVGAYDLPIEAYMHGAFYEDDRELSQEMFFTVTDGGPDGVIRLYD